MGWYEEHQNDNANPNNTDGKENNEERTVDSKGYINADDPSHDTEKYENVYDKPFEGTARETLNVPVKRLKNLRMKLLSVKTTIQMTKKKI